MTPDEYRKLYLGEVKPHPFESYSYSELQKIENDKFSSREHKRTARKIRMRRDEHDTRR